MMDVMSILIAMVMGYCMRWWWTIYSAPDMNDEIDTDIY